MTFQLCIYRPEPTAAASPNVTELAKERLRKSPYFALRKITLDHDGGVLTLRGRVASFHLKQLAQTLVSPIPGVGQVDNRIDVVAQPGSHAGRVSYRSAGSRHGR